MQKIQMITIPLYKHDDMTRVLDLKFNGLGSMPPLTLTAAVNLALSFTPQ